MKCKYFSLELMKLFLSKLGAPLQANLKVAWRATAHQDLFPLQEKTQTQETWLGMQIMEQCSVWAVNTSSAQMYSTNIHRQHSLFAHVRGCISECP